MSSIQSKVDKIFKIQNDLFDFYHKRTNNNPSKFSDIEVFADTLVNIGEHVGTAIFDDEVSGPYGSGSNRTSGGTYTFYWNFVKMKIPFLLTKVYWDVNTGRTYTLYIDNVSMGSVVATATGPIEFPIDNLIMDKTFYVFKLTASSSISLRDGPLAANDVFEIPFNTYFSNGTAYNYKIPIKLEGKKVANNTFYL